MFVCHTRKSVISDIRSNVYFATMTSDLTSDESVFHDLVRLIAATNTTELRAIDTCIFFTIGDVGDSRRIGTHLNQLVTMMMMMMSWSMSIRMRHC
jgi:hypothetical protein